MRPNHPSKFDMGSKNPLFWLSYILPVSQLYVRLGFIENITRIREAVISNRVSSKSPLSTQFHYD